MEGASLVFFELTDTKCLVSGMFEERLAAISQIPLSERGSTSPVSTVPNSRQGPGVLTSDVRMYTHSLGSESQVFSELRVRLLVCFTSSVQVPGRPTETQEVSMSFIRPITVNVVHPSGTTAQGLLLRDRQEHACDHRRDFTSHCGFFLRYCKVPWPGSQWTSNHRLSHR
jgi:hypothetical protein